VEGLCTWTIPQASLASHDTAEIGRLRVMPARRPAYYIWTVGCQMNKADSERIEDYLDSRGCAATDDPRAADVVILNTCAVRRSAETKAEGELGLISGMKKRRPGLKIAMTGCMVTADPDFMHRRYPTVDLFFSSLTPDRLDPLIEERVYADMPDLTPVGVEPVPIEVGPEVTPALAMIDRKAKHREVARWIPIIYGCNEHCTYCIVPSRRGAERSRPAEEIVGHIRQVVDEGAKEVTLLGQIVDAWGGDLPGEPDLADLLVQVDRIDGLERVRFLTSHPKYMNEKLIKTVAALPKVCEYIHLPIQHGDDALLRRMGRIYKVADYERRIEMIRRVMPHVAISTDIIVGFCGETDAQFRNLMGLLERIRYDVVYVAAYSPRPGTAANRFEDDVPTQLKKERLWQVEALQAQIASTINAPLVGTTQDVLVEERDERDGGVRWKGRTRTNKLTFFHVENPYRAGSDVDYRGVTFPVNIERATAYSLQGSAHIGTVAERRSYAQPTSGT